MSPKLPVVTGRQVLRALRKAGFFHDRTTGSHYILIHSEDPERQVSVPFHGGKDIKPGTLRAILRQADLDVEEFRRLI